MVADAVRFELPEARAWTAASSTALREYVWLGGRPLALVEGGATYWIHMDHLGTPRKMTDATGALVWDRVARPFGAAWSVGGSKSLALRFPGQVEDAATALHYNYFRDYDPSLGRYVQSDPIGLGGGVNTYGYALGNPLHWVDPKGLDVWLGGEIEVAVQPLSPFGSGSLGVMTNPSSGETCLYTTFCLGLGAGVLVAAGTQTGAWIFGPECGSDLSGPSGGFGADLIPPGGPGIGLDVVVGSGTGFSAAVGPSIGLGISIVAQGCATIVIGCTSTPQECQDCDK